jgi:hypothetical protein
MSSFSDEVVRQAWGRSDGRCECSKNHPWHYLKRCPQKMVWNDRRAEKITGWVAHYKISQVKGGSETLSNCQIICRRCLVATRTYK